MDAAGIGIAPRENDAVFPRSVDTADMGAVGADDLHMLPNLSDRPALLLHPDFVQMSHGVADGAEVGHVEPHLAPDLVGDDDYLVRAAAMRGKWSTSPASIAATWAAESLMKRTVTRRSERRTPSHGSSSSCCSQSVNASSKRRDACPSVSTAKDGSMRASTGRSRSRSAQKP